MRIGSISVSAASRRPCCTRWRDRASRGRPLRRPSQKRADLAASFQKAVVDVLVAKSRQALRRTGLRRLAVGGGVAANRVFRTALEEMTRDEGAELFIPPLSLCTDNAAMAAVAVEKWRQPGVGRARSRRDPDMDPGSADLSFSARISRFFPDYRHDSICYAKLRDCVYPAGPSSSFPG